MRGSSVKEGGEEEVASAKMDDLSRRAVHSGRRRRTEAVTGYCLASPVAACRKGWQGGGGGGSVLSPRWQRRYGGLLPRWACVATPRREGGPRRPPGSESRGAPQVVPPPPPPPSEPSTLRPTRPSGAPASCLEFMNRSCARDLHWDFFHSIYSRRSGISLNESMSRRE